MKVEVRMPSASITARRSDECCTSARMCASLRRSASWVSSCSVTSRATATKQPIGGVVAHVGEDALDLAPRADRGAGCGSTPLRRDPPRREVFEDAPTSPDVIGMDERQHVRARSSAGVVPEDLAHRRAHEDELTAFVEPERDVGGAVHQLAEPLLRLTEPLVGLTLLAFANADEQRSERAERLEAKLADPVGERRRTRWRWRRGGWRRRRARISPTAASPCRRPISRSLVASSGRSSNDEDHRLVEIVDEVRQPADHVRAHTREDSPASRSAPTRGRW